MVDAQPDVYKRQGFGLGHVLVQAVDGLLAAVVGDAQFDAGHVLVQTVDGAAGAVGGEGGVGGQGGEGEAEDQGSFHDGDSEWVVDCVGVIFSSDKSI